MKEYLKWLVVFISLLTISCSGTDITSPIDSTTDSGARPADGKLGNRMLWGLWEFRGDLRTGELDIIPMRHGMIHLNALAFLEPPPGNLLKIAGPIEINGNEIDVNIALTHPFAGDTTFTGFDVKGIIITPGNDARYPGPFVVMADDETTHLANPDGYTLWWGPFLFPTDSTWPNQGYIDGLLGQPYDLVDYASNVNAYKYFCDDLGPYDDLSLLKTMHRGIFSIGKTNLRHYKIKVVDDIFVFNYAVDANWAWPNPIPPANVYLDFPPKANQPEAYRVEVEEVKNTLYYDGYFGGGDLILDVTVYTWRHPTTTLTVFMESPEVFTNVFSDEPVEMGEGWARYRLTATSCSCMETGELFVLIGVQTKLMKIYIEQGAMDDHYGMLAAYFPHRTTVGTIPPTDGQPGAPRGIHKPEGFIEIPVPPMYIRTTANKISNVGVRGDRVVIPMWLEGFSSVWYRIAYADSHDGGETFNTVLISSESDPHIGGGNYNKTWCAAIDSQDGVHILYNGSPLAPGNVPNYSYTKAGESPSLLVFPLGTEPITEYPRIAYILLDDNNYVHIVYLAEIDGQTYHYKLCEMISEDYLNFSEPVECMVFPDSLNVNYIEEVVFALAGDGEIFVVFKGGEYDDDEWVIYYCHGFPGAMTECVQVNDVVEKARYPTRPDMTLVGKDAYVTWINQMYSCGGTDYDYSWSQISYIPYGAEPQEPDDLNYPAGIALLELCQNSWGRPVFRLITGSSDATNNEPTYKKASQYKLSLLEQDGTIYGNFLIERYSWVNNRHCCVSNSGIVMFDTGSPDAGNKVDYLFAPFDHY